MVAVAGPASAMTADVFLQMTATLVHLTNIQNSTTSVQPALPVVAPIPLPGYRVESRDATIDMDIIPASTIYELKGSSVKLPCDDAIKHSFVRKLEWKCRGCFSISETRESRLALFENDEAVSLAYPERFHIAAANYSLAVQLLENSDSGTYFCIVNGRNTPTNMYKLAVQDVPSAPGKPLIMTFNSRSVNLSWAPPLNTHYSPVSHYLIHVLEGEHSTWPGANHIVETKTPETTFTVPKLKPFTVYSFKVTAVNSIGNSEQSHSSYHMVTLREVPSGKPTITSAHNTSSTAISISWRPPNDSSINGEFLGYRVWYRPRDSETSNIEDILIKDPKTMKQVITGLDTYTQYLVSVQVVNPEGFGPSSTVVVMTDEGVPTEPLNMTASDISNTSLVVKWEEPLAPNGIILGYRLYYMHKVSTDVKSINNDVNKVMVYKLEGLDPYTRYKIWVRAFTWKNEGEPGASIQVLTDVSGPESPTITNLTCTGDSTVYIEWQRPDVFYHSVDQYTLYYRNTHVWKEKHIAVSPTQEQLLSKILLPNLTTNAEYDIQIRGGTHSLYTEGFIHLGDLTEMHKIRVGIPCNGILVSPMREEGLSETTVVSVGIVVGTVAVFLVLLVAVLLLGCWRRHIQLKRYYVPNNLIVGREEIPLWDVESCDEDCRKTAIPANIFHQHVAMMHADSDIGFTKEYEHISVASKCTSPGENSNSGLIKSGRCVENSDQILDAYFIDGFQRSQAFIVSPTLRERDTDSFWWMVHEKAVSVIVMDNQTHSNLFLPSQTQTFGAIDVTPTHQTSYPAFKVKKFQICFKKDKKVNAGRQLVSVFEYTGWAGALAHPRNPLEFLRFVRMSSMTKKNNESSILVTSREAVTYIIVDTMLKQLKHKGEMNVVTYCRHIQQQCKHLVLTEEQYIFVHDVLSEAVASGETNIHRLQISQYISSLQNSFITDEHCVPWQLLDRQFKLATTQPLKESQYMSALRTSNHMKNQSLDFLPIEETRVVLQSAGGMEGSDYINASWVPGYNRGRQFIISQHPAEQTCWDFWNMIWQTNTSVIICLSVFQHPFGVFWPHQNVSISMGNLRLSLSSEGMTAGYQSKTLSLVSEKDGRSSVVQLILCPNWPHKSVPVSNCVHLVDSVTKLCRDTGPMVVLDQFGATEAGIFCLVANLVKQVDCESHADVYYWFKTVNHHRPGIWVSPDNMLFVYRVMDELCSVKNVTDNHASKYGPLEI